MYQFRVDNGFAAWNCFATEESAVPLQIEQALELLHSRGSLAANVRHAQHAQAGRTGRCMSARWKGSGVIALQDGAFLLVGQDLLSNVVDHHRTFEVGYGSISAVLLSNE